jgi:DNA-binding NarL/FixJ family response regulator
MSRPGRHSFVVHASDGERAVIVQDLASLERVSLSSLVDLPTHLRASLDRDRRSRGRRERLTKQKRFARLTRSESRVAALALAGFSNREIAESLELRPRTVESHLTAAYRKLGISSRRELEGALRGERSR